MATILPKIYIARHGETAWTVSGQHTSFSDIELTQNGEEDARRLGAHLKSCKPLLVLSSPRKRALQTAALAGFVSAESFRTPETKFTNLVVDQDLAEWNYGKYEGITTAEILKTNPGWLLFRDGCPGGESFVDVAERADRIIKKVRAVGGDVLLFGHGHFSRILAARWVNLPVQKGAALHLSPGSLSVLSYEHTVHEAVIYRWNEQPK